MCKFYCTSSGPSTNLACLSCGCRYCGACLHGEAGKMVSLIKCAKCGKKPTVKPNGERGDWATVNNPPCNEQGGPRYDEDDGAANSAFTSGSRTAESASKRSHSARPASPSPSCNIKGPERFFYDKSSYTGTHTKGGPSSVAKGGGSATDSSWKRPVSGYGSKLLPEAPRPCSNSGLRSRSAATSNSTLAPPSPQSGQVSSRSPSRDADTTRASPRSPSTTKLRGPERFFYDKSSYTGTHTKGGPSAGSLGTGTSVDQSWKRSS